MLGIDGVATQKVAPREDKRSRAILAASSTTAVTAAVGAEVDSTILLVTDEIMLVVIMISISVTAYPYVGSNSRELPSVAFVSGGSNPGSPSDPPDHELVNSLWYSYGL